MNEFDLKVKQQKRSYALWMLLSGALVVVIIGLVLIWSLLVRGHAVVVSPEQAQASQQFEVQNGWGFFVADKLYVLSTQLSFQAKARDFEPRIIQVDTTSPKLLSVVLEPSPGTLSAAVSNGDSETAWYLDEELVHLGPDWQQQLKPGHYTLRVDSPYHQPFQQSLEIVSNKRAELNWTLSEISGELLIQSVPEHAGLTLNGEVLGPTPQTLRRQGGKYQVKLTLPGYQSLEDEVALTTARPKEVRKYLLKPLEATLNLDLQPEGGQLLIGGKQVATQGTLSLAANQSHQLLYQKPGYFSHSQQIRLKPGEQQDLAIQLKPEKGKVVVKASPEARVYLDGKDMGLTPWQQQLPALSYQLELTRPGYRTQRHSIKPSSQSVTQVDVQMLTEYQARRKEGKPTVASQLGIELALMQPGQVLMGSADNEKGRRRNEFQRQVSLSKAFYVSRHEITEAQFAAATGKSLQSHLPVSDVSWLEAAAFCNWLSEQEGLLPFYQLDRGRYLGFDPTSHGYRLPTEAEWEWLAKKAQRATETQFVWGDNERIPKDAGNFADESLKGSQTFYLKDYQDKMAGKAPVGQYARDRAGLFDLAGNVSEWVHDWYSNQPPDGTLQVDPFGASSGSAHIYKGANYQSGRLTELRSAWREPLNSSAPFVGFRIVRYVGNEP
ncbi:PEGA domain-containing protein [Bowmanella denitrificans]|uniref:PEGA domain-containing protein n=1 Tax=Bowmanella denitrificans TaxID=366582 RepID=A0ABN0XHI7_9ALTE